AGRVERPAPVGLRLLVQDRGGPDGRGPPTLRRLQPAHPRGVHHDGAGAAGHLELQGVSGDRRRADHPGPAGHPRSAPLSGRRAPAPRSPREVPSGGLFGDPGEADLTGPAPGGHTPAVQVLLPSMPPGRLDARQTAAPTLELIEYQDAAGALASAAEAEGFYGHPTPELLRAAPRLRWVQVASAGVEGYLFPELVQSDVVLTNAK